MRDERFPTCRGRDRFCGEDGIVLPLTLMVLLVLATLVAALLAMGTAEPQITANLARGAQAVGLAEGGAERAVAYFATKSGLVQSACNPGPCNGSEASTTLWSAQSLTGGTYTVTYKPVGFGTILVDSVGQTSTGNAQRRVQVMITSFFSTKDAILGSHINLQGNVDVDGTLGSVHANDDASLSGSAHVQVAVTTSGDTCTNCTGSTYVGDTADSGTGKPPQYIPPVNPTDFASKADYVLQWNATTKTGTILIVSTGAVVAPGASPFGGWGVDNSGNWSFSGGGTPPDGTYYSANAISIASSPGTVSSPWHATFAANSVNIDGHPVIVPSMGDTIIVADTVTLKGTGGNASLTGAVLAAPPPPAAPGNVSISGGVTLTGNIVSNGTVDVQGSAGITYGGKTHTPIPINPTVISWSTLSQ